MIEKLTEKLEVPFKIDGVSYSSDKIVITSITRNFNILDGDNAGRTVSGRVLRDVIGTFYNYSMTFKAKDSAAGEYGTLVETLSAPVDFHEISFPFGNKTITQRMYVTSGSDKLIKFSPGVSEENKFSDISVNFISEKPFLIP